MPAKRTAAPINLAGLDALDGLGAISFESLMNSDRTSPPRPGAAVEPSATPMMVSAANIEEQPHQVRKRFQLDDMRASIRENLLAGRPPIKTPLIVKAIPGKPDKWELWDGARRLRSAKLEGVDELPIIVDENFDDFDQVVVNLQRDGNTPVEIADFIAKKLAEGFKKGDIAKRLGVANSWISKHVALIDMPASIRQAYEASRINDVEAMYLLISNYMAHRDAIEALCTSTVVTISKYTVMKLIDEWKASAVSEPEPVGIARATSAAPFISTIITTGSQGAGVSSQSAEEVLTQAGAGSVQNGAAPSRRILLTEPQSAHGAAAECGQSDQRSPALPAQLHQPVVQVLHEERAARLLMAHCNPGAKAWIRYDSDGEHVQVDIGSLKLSAIVPEK